ncbi:hypothetical protein ACQ4OC_01360 [Yersinia sp. J1]|uniref:hypothetical protein n=1 Tax=Yersinia TaxID=629 RepID=UPI0015C61676|nr:hypothetical protein [Yersinia entomophaga]
MKQTASGDDASVVWFHRVERRLKWVGVLFNQVSDVIPTLLDSRVTEPNSYGR